MKRILSITCLLLGLWVSALAEPQTWENVLCGETVKIYASAAGGYEFLQWDDGNTDNPREVSVYDTKIYTAQFKKAGGTTDVDEVNANAPKARKMIIKDKLYIQLGDKLYDATGKRVK